MRADLEPDWDWGADAYRITVIRPSSIEDVAIAGEHIRSGKPLLLNISDLAEADRKPFIDYVAGLAFGLYWVIERVTQQIFLLSPPNLPPDETTLHDPSSAASDEPVRPTHDAG